MINFGINKEYVIISAMMKNNYIWQRIKYQIIRSYHNNLIQLLLKKKERQAFKLILRLNLSTVRNNQYQWLIINNPSCIWLIIWIIVLIKPKEDQQPLCILIFYKLIQDHVKIVQLNTCQLGVVKKIILYF